MIRFFGVCAGILLACAAAPVAAQKAVSSELSAPQLFELAESAEADGRPADAEAMLRALTRDPEIEIRTEARFRLALLLERLKRQAEAAVELRGLLDEKPDAQRVRIELAGVLATLGDESGARRELRQVQAGKLPPQISQAINQFANALRSRKPFGASLELALVPDSNINRATDTKTLDTIIAPLELSRDARERSGIGARVAGQAFLRRSIGSGLYLVPRVSAQGEFYGASQFNDVSASALVGLEWSPGSERIQVSGGGTMRWYGGNPYARTITSSLNWQHPLNKRTALSSTVTFAQTDYRQNDLQDGLLVGGTVALERAFTQSTGGSLELSIVRQTANDSGYANVSSGVSALYWREIGRTTIFTTAALRGLEADARLFLYPERRRDILLSATIGGTLRLLRVRSFAPVIRVTYERNFSSVGIYDYQRLATTIGITRAF